MRSWSAASSDAELVAAALAGAESAFNEIVRRHKRTAFRLIRRYVGDNEEAYDLLQETFVAAWSSLSSFDADKPFPSWLRRIALNKCRDWSRRRKVRSFFFTAQSIGSSLRGVDVPIETVDHEREEELSQLDRAIASLPRKLKEPLLLTALEGLSHKEAADLLRVTPKAIETRVYRARQILSRRFSSHSEEAAD